MEIIKSVHVLCAYLTGVLFLVRSALILVQHRSLQSRINKITPHVIDTLLLISGFTLAMILSFNPAHQPWLASKLLFIVLYILSGIFAFRLSKTTTTRLLAILIGIACYIVIVFLAHSKTNLLTIF